MVDAIPPSFLSPCVCALGYGIRPTQKDDGLFIGGDERKRDNSTGAVLHHKTALNPSQIYGQAKSQVGEISASRVSAC